MKKAKNSGVLAPLVITLLTVLFAVCLTALAAWAFYTDTPPLIVAVPLGILIFGFPVFTIYGIIASFIERTRELKKGEEDAASKY